MPLRRFSFLQRILALSWPLIFLMTFMSCLGFAILFSAAKGHFDPWASAQMTRFAMLFPLMLAIAVVDIRIWLKFSYVIYGVVLLLLILVEVSGTTAMGATRWFRIGPFNIQPSEPMKICIIFALARYFHAMPLSDVARPVMLIPPLLMIAAPFLLIMKQPDLGTALILLLIGAIIFFVAGVRMWKFALVGITGLATLPILWQYVMHDYQKKRVLTFLDPESDPLGDGYNILQSKIAIGSGGFTGKGFLHGSQSQLSFLPEKQTDFIFTMFSEEFGFIGGVAVILLYTIIIIYGMMIALNCRNHYGRLLGMGVVGLLFLHIFINIGMTMGLLPIVGAPLPLLSYGGTIMSTILIAFGLLLNVHLYSDEKIDRNTSEL